MAFRCALRHCRDAAPSGCLAARNVTAGDSHAVLPWRGPYRTALLAVDEFDDPALARQLLCGSIPLVEHYGGAG